MCLTYFIKGSITMINEQIAKFRVDVSNQRGSFAFKETITSATNHNGAYRQVWSLESSGLSLYSRSTKAQADFANSGREDGVHSEASLQRYSTHQKLCKIRWILYKRNCEPSAGRFSQKKRLWLREIAKNRFIYLTALIDWIRRNFLKFIDSWSRIGILPITIQNGIR